MTEREKMQLGIPYNPNYDEELTKERLSCKKLCKKYNNLEPEQLKERVEVINQLFGNVGDGAYVEQPFYCDYGYNIEVGKNFYSNHNLVILDCGKVKIGDFVFIGPDCGIYTAGHPVNVKDRNAGIEYAYPITIEDNVWLGGGVKIMPGVTIGKNSIIGSGSIVTKDIPQNVIAAGNPCKVIREVREEDRI